MKQVGFTSQFIAALLPGHLNQRNHRHEARGSVPGHARFGSS
jgi:hypothetical protein